MNEVFGLNRRAEENLYLLSLDTKNNLIGIFEISKGTVCATFCRPREIFIRLLLSGAVGFVLIHNHPGTQRLCDYSNETFTVIDKEILGYEILEGVQYKVYKKVLKAFDKYTKYCTRFKDVYFKGRVCTVQARECFKTDVLFEISFTYNSKITIKSIGELLKERDNLQN